VNPLASTFITSALAFYTIGVWGERIIGRLRWWNFAFFVLGLVCDTLGTGMMFAFVGGMSFDVHGISGVIAIVLMPAGHSWSSSRRTRSPSRSFTGSPSSCGSSG